MHVTALYMSNYIGVHRNYGKKYIQQYIDILELKRTWITVYDVAKVDEIPVKEVAFLMGYPNKFIQNLQ